MEPPTAPHLNVCLLGECNSGKSTVSGWIIREISEQKSNRRLKDKLDVQAREMGRMHGVPWHLDKLKQERERGITIYGNLASVTTHDMKKYVLLDPPGRRPWEQRLIRFLCQADAVIITIDVTKPFDGLFSDRAVTLMSYAYMFSVRQVIVVVTNMDGIRYREDQFNDLKAKVHAKLLAIGFKEQHVIGILPVCNVEGANYDRESPKLDKMPWWKGDALETALAKCTIPPRDRQGPALIVFSKAYKIGGVGTVLVGGIIKGTLKRGDILMTVPGMVKKEAVAIEVWHRPVQEAYAGDIIGVNIKGISHRVFVKHFRGFLVAAGDKTKVQLSTNDYIDVNLFHPAPEDRAQFEIPTFTKSVVADVLFVKTRVSKRGRPLDRDLPVAMISRLMTVRARIKQYIALLNKKDFSVKDYLPAPDSLRKGDLVRVELSLHEPVPLAEFSRLPSLARVILSDTISIVGAGVIRALTNVRNSVKMASEICAPFFGKVFDQRAEALFSLQKVNITKPLCLEHLEGTSVLTISCSKRRTTEEKQLMQQFVKEGGSLILVIDSYQAIQNTPLLTLLGITLGAVPNIYNRFHATFPVLTPEQRAHAIAMTKPSGGQVSPLDPAKTAPVYSESLRMFLAKYRYPEAKAAAQKRVARPWAADAYLQRLRNIRPQIMKGAAASWKHFDTPEAQSSFAKAVKGFSAWLPAEIWGEVFRHIDPWDVCQCQSVCKAMQTAACREEVWVYLCQKRGITSHFKAMISSSDASLIAQSLHKWKFKNYITSARQGGGNLLRGPHGKVSFMSINPYLEDKLLYFRLDPASPDNVKGTPLAVMPRRSQAKDGVLLAHFNRFKRYGKGQIVVVISQGYGDNSPGNVTFGLNLVQDSHLYAFHSPQFHFTSFTTSFGRDLLPANFRNLTEALLQSSTVMVDSSKAAESPVSMVPPKTVRGLFHTTIHTDVYKKLIAILTKHKIKVIGGSTDCFSGCQQFVGTMNGKDMPPFLQFFDFTHVFKGLRNNACNQRTITPSCPTGFAWMDFFNARKRLPELMKLNPEDTIFAKDVVNVDFVKKVTAKARGGHKYSQGSIRIVSYGLAEYLHHTRFWFDLWIDLEQPIAKKIPMLEEVVKYFQAVHDLYAKQVPSEPIMFALTSSLKSLKSIAKSYPNAQTSALCVLMVENYFSLMRSKITNPTAYQYLHLFIMEQFYNEQTGIKFTMDDVPLVNPADKAKQTGELFAKATDGLSSIAIELLTAQLRVKLRAFRPVSKHSGISSAHHHDSFWDVQMEWLALVAAVYHQIYPTKTPQSEADEHQRNSPNGRALVAKTLERTLYLPTLINWIMPPHGN